ncbi:hypothetical protein JD969_03230 [Planctomycetota bacterium]|nr:hypothetical protein JD969_03230 [Planctomycetota bacterium]
MSSTNSNTQGAWEDRWTKPTFDMLMSVYDPAGRKRILEQLFANFDEFDNIRREIVWHGSAWKWTEQFILVDSKGKDIDILVFFVPNPETPQICVPLRKDFIDSLPMKRLNKFVREGIRSAVAKCAVEVAWASWSPNASTEVEHLTDLFKRKYKFMTGDKK